MYVTVRDRPLSRAAQSGTRRVPPVVVGLGLVSLLTDISSESVVAVLPLYLTGYLALSAVAYGFLDGLYQGVSAVVRIGAGWTSDRTGSPKRVALVGYGLSCVARVGLLFATGVASVTAVISADRIGKGIRTAPRDAMISAASDPDATGYAFGVHRTLDTVGAVMGPLIAFLVLWWIPDGYHTVFVISLAFAVLGVLLLGLLIRDPTPPPPATGRGLSTRPAFRWSQLADRRLRRLLVVTGLLSLLTVGDGFIYLAMLDGATVDIRWFPLLYVGSNVVYLLLAVPLGRLGDRIGRTRVFVGGHLAIAGAYASVVFPLAGPGATLAPLLLIGTFYAATDGLIAALAGSLVDAPARATGIAAAQTVVAGARFASSTIFGVLWFVMGPSTALLTVGGLLLAAIVLAFRVLAPLDRQQVVA